jgi:non-ribosomal peptide synthase protein (TIGR01720 family)
MNELAKRMAELSPEKRQLLALFLQEKNPSEAGRAPYRAPESSAERTLAEIWSRTLGVERIGLDDNFFELGGDSIQSIQIATRARQAGIPINTNLIFAHPTVAALAREVEANRPSARQVAEVVPNIPLSLTSIQRWFFAQNLPHPHWWNQAVLLQIDRQYTPAILDAAWRAIQQHHDALRLRFVQGKDGWTQQYAPISEIGNLDVVELETWTSESISFEATRWQQRLHLTAGPVARLVYLHCGGAGRARLLLTAHHLVIDGVSFRIILEDLQSACAQIEAGSPVVLDPKTTSYGEWAHALATWRHSAECLNQRSYWLNQLASREPARQSGLEGHVRCAVAVFEPAETRGILQILPARLGSTIEPVLIFALGRALTDHYGPNKHDIDIERHGREEIAPGLDLSRTVGWFTSIFPHKLKAPGGCSTQEAVGEIASRLAEVPSRGLGYQALRYMSPDEEFPANTSAEILFNYLGQFDDVAGSGIAPAPESPGAFFHPGNPRSHTLQLTARVLGGRFEATLTYPPEREDAPQLLEHFRKRLLEMLEEVQSVGSASAARAAYPDADLSDEDVAALFGPAEAER